MFPGIHAGGHHKRAGIALCAAAFVLGVWSAPVAAQGAAKDTVLAVINGHEIKRSAVETLQTQLPQQYRTVPLEQIFPALVELMMNTHLVVSDARARKLHEEAEYETHHDLAINQALERYAMAKEMDAKVDEAAVMARYKDVVAELSGSGQVHARHILLKTEDEAKAVIKELDGGADFAETAKKKSTGPSGPSGGDLGFFSRGQMVPEFEKAAFAMAKGAYTKTPVQTQFGWHVIKVEDIQAQPAPSFEEASPQIRQSMQQEVAAAYFERLRKGVDIKLFGLDGLPLDQPTIVPQKKN